MTTDFNKNTLNVGGGILPGSTDTPGDVRTRVETEADIMNIPNPFIGMVVYVLDTGKRFEITKLKDKKSGFTTVKNALVDEYIEFDPIKDKGYAKEADVEAALEVKADKTDLEGLASEEFVEGKVEEVVGEAPAEFDTLAEVAAELAKKVNAEEGKALMDVAEMERLAGVDNYDDAAVKERLDALEAIDHEEFLKEHQAIDHLAVKADVDAALELKADKADLEGLASEQFVQEKIDAIPEYDDSEVISRIEELEAIDHEAYIGAIAEAKTELEAELAKKAVAEEVEAALELKADKAELVGLATEEFVAGKVAELVNGAPETLDTLKEIADAMEAHEDVYEAYVETVKTALETKADKEVVEERFTAVEESVEAKFAEAAAKAEEDHAALEAKVQAEIERAQAAEVSLDERVEVLETLNLETKPYIDKNGMLVLCGCPAVARGVGEEVHVSVRFFNNEEDKFVFTKEEFAKLRICMGYGAEGVGVKRNIVETTLELYDIDKAFIIDGGSQITGEIGTVNIVAENVNYIDGIQGARAMNGGERNVVHNFNVKVKDVKLIDTLFGGGNGYSVVWNSNTEVDGDTTVNYLVAGGSNGYTNKSRVVLNGGHAKVMQGVNRGILNKAELIVNGGIVDNFYAAGEVDPAVTGVQHESYVELNGGQIVKFNKGISNSVEFTGEIKGHIMDCEVLEGDVSMLAKIEKHPGFVDKDEFTEASKVIDERVTALEAIDHKQPNFEYAVNMIAESEPASFSVSGEFPNLVITLNLPQCFAYRDPDAAKMWIGWIPYDEAGVIGFNAPEDIGAYLTMETIQQGIDYGSVVEMKPQVLNRVSIGSVDTEAGFVCAVIPEDMNYIAYLDNGVGTKLGFDEIESEDGSSGFMLCQNGTRLVNKIDDISYCLYGAYVFSPGERFIYIEEK